jgi:hypothetical protein
MELEKSKETGAELQTLTSAMTDIQETLNGGLVSLQESHLKVEAKAMYLASSHRTRTDKLKSRFRLNSAPLKMSQSMSLVCLIMSLEILQRRSQLCKRNSVARSLSSSATKIGYAR